MQARKDFDPGAPASGAEGIFGLPFDEDEARLVYLPVPWEATTSYGGGASKGPAAILKASAQIDLYDCDVEKPYAAGLYLRPQSPEVRQWDKQAKAAAQKVIAALSSGRRPSSQARSLKKRKREGPSRGPFSNSRPRSRASSPCQVK